METEAMPSAAGCQQQEVDRNYKAFKKVLPELLKSDPGRTALMRGGEVVMCFDTERDAIQAGRRFFEDRRFSIQKVSSRPVDLGYFSYFGVPPVSVKGVAIADRSIETGSGAPNAERRS